MLKQTVGDEVHLATLQLGLLFIFLLEGSHEHLLFLVSLESHVTLSCC